MATNRSIVQLVTVCVIVAVAFALPVAPTAVAQGIGGGGAGGGGVGGGGVGGGGVGGGGVGGTGTNTVFVQSQPVGGIAVDAAGILNNVEQDQLGRLRSQMDRSAPAG